MYQKNTRKTGIPRLLYHKILLIMRLTTVILIVSFLQVSASSLAQKITLNKSNESIQSVFKAIKSQSGYNFFYTDNLLKGAKPINITVRDAELTDVLSLIFADQPFEYELKNKTVIVVKMENSHLKNAVKGSRFIDVSGVILDESGQPLPAAMVKVKGTNKGTATNEKGRFTLPDVIKGDVLVISYIGYKSQEVVVGDNSSITITLEVAESTLEEVSVVVGFGVQKKESMVASVSTIKGEQLKMPNRSLSNSLAGKVSGLIAVQRSGEPGYDNAEIWIRGVSSFAGGTNPLVLVDGVPRQMNDIEPDEIESFTLLKDAAATSVYGSEGANGVILITSKRGTIQKTSISYRGEASRLTPTRIPKFANSYDYLSLYNEALTNDGDPEMFSPSVLAKYRSGEDSDLYPSVNWWDALISDYTTNNRHTLNFRGGGERMRYFVSGAYFGESGLYKVNSDYNNNANLNRYNLRSNIDIDLTKSLLMKVDLSGQYLKVNRPYVTSDQVFTGIYGSPPHVIPVIYSDGSMSENAAGIASRNPYVDLVEKGYRKEWRSGIQSKVELTQKLDVLTQGLRVRGLVSFDANSLYNMSRSKTPDTYIAKQRDANGNLELQKSTNATPFGNPATSSSGDKNIYMETSVNYDRLFNKHQVSGMFLYYQKEKQLDNEALAFRKQAWVGRGTYTFDKRYSLEANFSITGSEQFAEGHRMGFFPAVGVAWNVSHEPFFPEEWQNAVSVLKLRASVGKTGNDLTGGARFLYRSTFGTGTGYNFGIGTTGSNNGVGSSIIEGRFEAPVLSWELELKRNFGIELTLLNGKINLQADYFDNERSNILLQRKTVSGVAGLRQAPWQNFGVVSNKGIDGNLNVTHKVGNFDLSLMGTFTFARNKILEYDEVPPPYPWMAVTNTRLNSVDGLIAERLFEASDFDISTDGNGKKVYKIKDGIATYSRHPNPLPGDIKYKDLNGDGKVDDNLDIVRDLAYPDVPEIIYGFGINLKHKGFYTNLFFQGATNVSFNLLTSGGGNGNRTLIPFYEGVNSSSVRQEIIDSRWTEANPSQNVLYPRVSIRNSANTTYNTSTATGSSWWVKDASFLRLKNLEFGYLFSGGILPKLKLNQARVYIMGQNVALWDKLKLQDPELMGKTGTGAQYPIPRIWSFGLDITL